MRRPIAFVTTLAGLLVIAAVGRQPTTTAAGQGGGQPRGRSVTLGDLTAFDVKDNFATVSAGADQLRVIFYRDDLFRLWLGPDGQFTDAQPNTDDAQMVVWTVRRSRWLRATPSPLAIHRLSLRSNAAPLASSKEHVGYLAEMKPLTTVRRPADAQRGETELRRRVQNVFLHRTRRQHPAQHAQLNDGATPNPVPFYMSTAGYGVFRNTMTPGAMTSSR